MAQLADVPLILKGLKTERRRLPVNVNLVYLLLKYNYIVYIGQFVGHEAQVNFAKNK